MGKKRSGPKPPKMPKEKPAKVVADDDTIATHAHILIGQQRIVKQEQTRLNAFAKAAGQNGVSWKAVKDVMKEYEQPADKRRLEAQQKAAVCTAIGVPVQIELFEAYEPKVNDTEAEAYRKGRFASICHGECKPPYPAGSKEGQKWMDGWHDVQRLVSQHNTRLENKAPPESSAATDDDWDDPKNKPVASAAELDGVNHDPDAPPAAEPPAEDEAEAPAPNAP